MGSQYGHSVEVGHPCGLLAASTPMTQARIPMRQLRELLRLHFDEGLSQRLIARGLGVVRSTVERVLNRFAAAGLTWPLDPDLSDEELERRLYRGPAHQGAAKRCARPNYAEVSKQLARSEEHTSELQSLMRISYAVFCLKKKKTKQR